MSKRKTIITPPPITLPAPPREDDPEDLFGKTMAYMAKQIQDDMSRDTAKIECQQIMLRYRAASRNTAPRRDMSSNAAFSPGFGNVTDASAYRQPRNIFSPISVNTGASHGYNLPSPSFNGAYRNNQSTQEIPQSHGFINITSPISNNTNTC